MKRLLPVVLCLAACTSSGTGTPPVTQRASTTPGANVSAPSTAGTPSKPHDAKQSKPRRHLCRYAFPVEPDSEVHYGAFHHDYPATDIFAPAGSRFVAPTDGTVNWVSLRDRWKPALDDPATRGGLSAAIIGEDGIRYYGSHLRTVAAGIRPGKRVRAGQKLGEVGNTGDARGIATHLHFGISHPTYAADWRVRRGEVTPFPYLDAWKKGRLATPTVKGARAPTCKPID